MQNPFNMSYTIGIFSPNHNLETINCRGIVIIYKMHLCKLGGEGEKGGEDYAVKSWTQSYETPRLYVGWYRRQSSRYPKLAKLRVQGKPVSGIQTKVAIKFDRPSDPSYDPPRCKLGYNGSLPAEKPVLGVRQSTITSVEEPMVQ